MPCTSCFSQGINISRSIKTKQTSAVWAFELDLWTVKVSDIDFARTFQAEVMPTQHMAYSGGQWFRQRLQLIRAALARVILVCCRIRTLLLLPQWGCCFRLSFRMFSFSQPAHYPMPLSFIQCSSANERIGLGPARSLVSSSLRQCPRPL